MQLFNGKECVKICNKNKNKYVFLAVWDLIKDFERISECEVTPEIVNNEQECCIVIEENVIPDADAIKDESFKIETDGDKIRIKANGYLGTMWGIYTFCEKVLNVNPCYLFDDLEMQKQPSLDVNDICIADKPDGFTFRGIFINDEDFLTGWKDAGGVRYLDFPWYGVTVSEEVMNMVVETALRLRLNLIIPASFLDIDNPDEKILADCVAKRGIFISQHHIEPLGVSAFTFKNHCKKYGKKGEFSYIKHPELMEEVWRFYVRKWTEYDNVVWQIGLRGEGDRPVWQEEEPTDCELKEYGKIISSAYNREKEIVLEETEGKAKYFTSTLWMEGAKLLGKKYLTFQEDTTVVFADTGINQMFASDFYETPRDYKSGVYYHLQFYGSGPHLAPQTGLLKLYYNTRLAYEKGDSDYYIMNVSNIREFVYEMKAYSEMVWNIEKFDEKEYQQRHCERFGNFSETMKSVIKDYFENLPNIPAKYLKTHSYSKYFELYTQELENGIKNFILKEGDIIEQTNAILAVLHKDVELPLDKKVYYEELQRVIPIYEEISKRLDDVKLCVGEPLKKHIDVKWHLYTKTLLSIYKWYVNVYEAKQYCDLRNGEKMKQSILDASESLEEYLKMRKCAEYGIFENWYRGDLKMNIKQCLAETKRKLGRTVEV